MLEEQGEGIGVQETNRKGLYEMSFWLVETHTLSLNFQM
jgi:hypothetical protein